MKAVLFLSIFIAIIFFISNTLAIKISPTRQELIMNPYETNCTNIWVLPEDNYIISSNWSYDGKGNLEKYNFSTEKIKLSMNYSHISEGKYEICFTPKRGGNFSGIIYFYSEKNMVEIGTWIELRVESKTAIESISLITGNAMRDTGNLNLSLGLVFLLLVITLLLAIRRSFRRTRLIKDKHP